MKNLSRSVVLISLINKLRENGSWSGETHIQKATYFLQEFLHVPLDFSFVLYKHGPYSFDLTDTLTSMHADSLLMLHVRFPYGPSMVPTDLGNNLAKHFSGVIARYERQIAFVAKKIGDKGVDILEKLATALFITLNYPEMKQEDERASLIHKLKKHVSTEQAQDATTIVDSIVEEGKELVIG